VTATAAPITVTAPGTTTTISAAPAGTVTVTAGAGVGAAGAGGAGGEQATVTATVVLSVLANGDTVAVQTVAPTNGSTAGSGLVFTGQGAGTTSSGLAFTGRADRAMAGTGLALVALGGLALMLARRSPIRSRQH
ncbi:MAG: hypothetical protein JWN61_723, partial [Pseudonocardiales bacterium]|nr:hypothetical protein [Pseudonocardiales bacterium]